MEQQIQFLATRDGVKLAYATSGEGPPLVWAANWLTHLEFSWRSPVWRHWIQFFSRHHTLIRYDQRGCGLSDWHVDDVSFEGWVADLEAVLDRLGLERAPILGISQGGPVAIEYAVRRPERVSHLILHGTYGLGRFVRGDVDIVRQSRALLELMQVGWGRENPAFRQVFTSVFIPGATEEQARWFNDLMRISTTPAIAARIWSTFGHIDVTGQAPKVRVPTLVTHCAKDAAVGVEQGRRVAAAIPGARFALLESSNHIVLESEPAWHAFQRHVCSFLALPEPPAPAATPVPAAVPESSFPACPASGLYRFRECVLDVSRRELHRAGEQVPIQRKAFDLLVYLIENRDRAIGKDELQDALWANTIVTETSLTQCVRKVRRAVCDPGGEVIGTVHGHGYRFVADVQSD